MTTPFRPGRIWTQCVKELAQFRRDRLTVALALFLPIATLLIFGYAIRLESKDIPIAVRDLDRSPSSRAYIERLLATNQLRWASSASDAVDRGLAKALVEIPPDFGRRLKAGKSAPIGVYIDGTDTNNARVIRSSIQSVTTFYNQVSGLQPEGSLIHTRIRVWFNPGRKEAFYIVPGVYAVILAIWPPLLVALAVVREKEQGTIIQVYASSLSAAELLLGKTIAYCFIAAAQAVAIMLIGWLLFGVRLAGDPTPLLVGTVIYLFTSVLFGIFIGVRTNSQSAAVQGVATVGFLTALLLSGFIYPLSNIPFPLSLLSNIVPARYYIDITRDAFVRGTGWPGVWPAPLALALLGGLFFLAAWRTTRSMQLPD